MSIIQIAQREGKTRANNEAGIRSERTRPQGKATTSGFSGNAGFRVKPDIACVCRFGAPCIVCRRWDRAIHGIEARRADSLRRQSMGSLARAGR